MITLKEFFEEYGEDLKLDLVAGEEGMSRQIKSPDVHRPGLSLAGYLRGYAPRRILVFGRVEIEYVRDLDSETRRERLTGILDRMTPAVIVARRFRPPEELTDICEKEGIPLFPFGTTDDGFYEQVDCAPRR